MIPRLLSLSADERGFVFASPEYWPVGEIVFFSVLFAVTVVIAFLPRLDSGGRFGRSDRPRTGWLIFSMIVGALLIWDIYSLVVGGLTVRLDRLDCIRDNYAKAYSAGAQACLDLAVLEGGDVDQTPAFLGIEPWNDQPFPRVQGWAVSGHDGSFECVANVIGWCDSAADRAPEGLSWREGHRAYFAWDTFGRGWQHSRFCRADRTASRSYCGAPGVMLDSRDVLEIVVDQPGG